MSKKNGFTIVELLVTIVVISLIFSISFITVNTIIENSREKSSTIATNNLKNSANMYSKEYSNELIWEKYKENNIDLEKTCIEIDMLIAKGYLKKDVINDKTPKSIILIRDKNNNIIKEEEKDTSCGTYYKKVAIPTTKNICYDITYNGTQQHLINESNKSEFYSNIEYVNSVYNNETSRPINAGDYEVKVSLIDGKKWTDNTNEPKYVTCKINKATPSLNLNPPGNSDAPEEIGIKDVELTSDV